MNPILEKLHTFGVVPVVVLDDAKDAVPLAQALMDGGLPCAEVTFRTAAAEASIRAIKQAFPQMVVGAGTVLTPEQVDRAVDAGTQFIVSPGTNRRTVARCVERGVPITPGVCTPSDIERAMEFGLDVLKFFPAEPSGGLAMLKAIAPVYVGISFMPTGGVGPGNLRDYLAYDRIWACGGSWMVKGALIRAGAFDEIRRLTAEAVEMVKEVRG